MNKSDEQLKPRLSFTAATSHPKIEKQRTPVWHYTAPGEAQDYLIMDKPDHGVRLNIYARAILRSVMIK